MTKKHIITRLITGVLLAASMGSGVSCMTTYDAYGRPVQSVDPALAVAGAAAAGVIGYAAAKNHNNRHDNYYNRNYYNNRYYRGGPPPIPPPAPRKYR